MLPRDLHYLRQHLGCAIGNLIHHLAVVFSCEVISELNGVIDLAREDRRTRIDELKVGPGAAKCARLRGLSPNFINRSGKSSATFDDRLFRLLARYPSS
jgi:hypothetical protein